MINKQMSIGEVLRIDRNVAPIFMQFGMHCLGCPHATAESIELACAAHGTDADALVAKLNEYFEAKKYFPAHRSRGLRPSLSFSRKEHFHG